MIEPAPKTPTIANLRPLLANLDAEAVKVLHDVFADRHRIEVNAEEDFFRTLPFFATALGVGVAGASFALTHLPLDLLSSVSDRAIGIKLVALLCVLLMTASAVLAVWCVFALLYATGALEEWPVLSEAGLLEWIVSDTKRLLSLKGSKTSPDATDIRARLVANYRFVNASKRTANQVRRTARSRAIARLLLSFLCSFAVTVTIFIFERLKLFT